MAFFPLWSIAENITISSLADLKRGALIDPQTERAMAEQWQTRMGIRTPDMDSDSFIVRRKPAKGPVRPGPQPRVMT